MEMNSEADWKKFFECEVDDVTLTFLTGHDVRFTKQQVFGVAMMLPADADEAVEIAYVERLHNDIYPCGAEEWESGIWYRDFQEMSEAFLQPQTDAISAILNNLNVEELQQRYKETAHEADEYNSVTAYVESQYLKEAIDERQ